MKYPSYPEYVATNNKWYPEIPKEWDVRRIKFSFQDKAGAIKTGPFGSQLKSEEMNGSDYKVYNQRNVIQQDLSLGDEYIDEEKYNDLSAFEIFENDLLVTTRGTIGKCIRVGSNYKKGILHPCLMRLQFKDEMMLNEYFVYLLQESNLLLDELMLGSNATTLEVIYSDTLKNISSPIPPLSEQRVIVRFLDYKTRQIDQLIEKKNSLIEKLNEQRIAVITQAVTKGLDKNAKMKPSGVDWLGDVPAHWGVMSIKFSLAIPITDGPHETPEFLNEGVPFISAESVKNDRLDFDKKRGFISQEDHERYSKKYKPKKGDVYMVKSGATTGNVARVETDEEFNIWSPLAVFRPDPERTTTDFIFYFTKSKPFFTSVELSWSYGTQQNIGMGVISNLKIAIPPVTEQNEITKYIEKEITHIDGMTEKAQEVINRLREYRSALITDAVTGKIDVRNVVVGEVA